MCGGDKHQITRMVIMVGGGGPMRLEKGTLSTASEPVRLIYISTLYT
jgi:hypothetical protein